MSGAFAGERVVVIGLGVAGAALARAFAEEGASVVVSEARADAKLDVELRDLGVELRAGGHERSHLHGATLVATSPGVPEHAQVLAWTHEMALPVWGELEVGSRLVKVPYLAVTGTNGKTTTTAMIEACLRASGLDAVACGNIGRPFPTAARERHDVLVVEASSFQLRMQDSFHPRVSVLLNLAPDHLDWHGSFGMYREAKARIFARQGEGDHHVGNRDDPHAAAVSRTAHCATSWFTLGDPAEDETGYRLGRIVEGWGGHADLGAPSFATSAMRADAAACAAACRAFGLDPEPIRASLASFRLEAHRGEVVAMVSGVRFVDDSKATNPHATLAAVGDDEGVVLIAGGRAKGVDLSPLAELGPSLAAVVAIGEAADELVGIFDERVPTRKAGSIEEAVRSAFELAPRDGTVLLAPACASWDMFRDYRERGDRFAAAARSLIETEGEDGVG